jgi:hypothetical protein
MRKVIAISFFLSFVTIISAASSFGQQTGIRVEANIPFDFVVGKEKFSAGEYNMVLVRTFGDVYSALLKDENGKVILKTTAFLNGSLSRDGSKMVFAVTDGGRYLDKLQTPGAGYRFNWKAVEGTVAEAKKIAVPTKGGPKEN